jgi:hypothetical protein
VEESGDKWSIEHQNGGHRNQIVISPNPPNHRYPHLSRLFIKSLYLNMHILYILSSIFYIKISPICGKIYMVRNLI